MSQLAGEVCYTDKITKKVRCKPRTKRKTQQHSMIPFLQCKLVTISQPYLLIRLMI